MINPKITVLISVYNGEKYLQETIESVLSQSYKNFELLIIDDKSTDKTCLIINSFKDPRIKLFINNQRLGLSKSLNVGINLSSGDYIARLDADDICHQNRLEIQKLYLENNPDCGILATNAILINQYGHDNGFWNADIETNDYHSIINRLPFENCIVQSSVMGRKKVFLAFLYDESLSYAEDYDLWLRIAFKKIRIEKINKYLVFYRKHSDNLSYKYNIHYKNYLTLNNIRIKLLMSNRFTDNFAFSFQLFIAMLDEHFHNFRIFLNFHLKRIITYMLLSIGNLLYLLKKQQIQGKIIFLFPYFHTGGAERVHSDIVFCLKKYCPIVIFTGKSKDASFLNRFKENAKIIEFSLFLKYSLFENVLRWIIGGYIISLIKNNQESIIISSNSLLFYNILPKISDCSKTVDIIHAFSGGLEEDTMHLSPFLNKRILITPSHFNEITKKYSNYHFEHLLERIEIISNGVEIPSDYPKKLCTNGLKILFIGRNSPEKRPKLIGKIADECKKRKYPVVFFLIGDFFDLVEINNNELCKVIGELSDDTQINNYYNNSDIILNVSIYEGFPMSLMEAMSHGVVPIATNVGGIQDHIHNDYTGLLIQSKLEQDIIQEICNSINFFIENPDKLHSMSLNCYEYSVQNFSKIGFCEKYKKLVESLGH